MDTLKVLTALVDKVDETKMKMTYEVERPNAALLHVLAELIKISPDEMLNYIIRDYAIGIILDEEEARAIEAEILGFDGEEQALDFMVREAMMRELAERREEA